MSNPTIEELIAEINTNYGYYFDKVNDLSKQPLLAHSIMSMVLASETLRKLRKEKEDMDRITAARASRKAT